MMTYTVTNAPPIGNTGLDSNPESNKIISSTSISGLHPHSTARQQRGSGERKSGNQKLHPQDFVNNPMASGGHHGSSRPSAGFHYGSSSTNNSLTEGRDSSTMSVTPLMPRSSRTRTSRKNASYSKSSSYSKLCAIAPRSLAHTSNGPASGAGLRELTINKLRYAEVDFYGREKELEIMQNAFKRSFENSARELVVLAGRSGTGKTRLCQELYKSIKGGFYFNFHGKFNRSNNLPYAGFALACEKFVAFLYSLKLEEMPTESRSSNSSLLTNLRQSAGVRTHSSRFRSSLSDSYNDALNKHKPTCVFTYTEIIGQLTDELDKQEMSILVQIIPVLDKLFGVQEDVESNVDDYTQLNLQFIHAFKKFIRVVATFSPLVVTLEDLQWSDLASLKLIEALVTDFENGCGTLFIGCYRSEEVPEGHFLLNFVADLAEMALRFDGQVTQIECGNLAVEHINRMIADLMSHDPGKTKELAELVHRKTMGNALFAIQYLSSLTDMNLLTFSLGKFEWQWNLEEIDIATSATKNVVDLLLHRLKKLPDGVTRMLPLIASLGFSFQKSVFNLVANHFNIVFSKEDSSFEFLNPDKVITICLEEGLFDQFGQGWYVFIHDKLQEAAFSLLTEGELTKLQFDLGALLVDELPPDGLELLLFVTVSLLNSGYGSCSTGTCRRHELAELNLRAGVKAIESASFESAVSYLSAGINLLSQNHWHDRYELSLELYSIAAQAYYSLGNFDAMESHCSEILRQTDRALYDKRRAYNTLMDSIGAQDRMGDAAQLCILVLEKLGCQFPKRGHAFLTIIGLVHTVATIKKRTPDQIAKYGVMTDPEKIWAMNLLDKLFTFLYQDKSDMVPLCILKSLNWTIKYGVSDVAMPNFASVGFMLAAFLGDFNAGEIYANHALESLEKLGSDQIRSRTLLVAYGSVLHWKNPFDTCRQSMLDGYHVGLKMGDVESGLWCILFYLWFSLFLGTPLSNLSADLQIYGSQMKNFTQKKHEAWTTLFHQTVLNLIGDGGNKNMYLLVGEVVDEVELMKEADYINILKPALNLFQMYAMFYFQQYERVVKIIEDNGDGYFEKSIPGVAALMTNTFHSALSCIAMTRKTGKGKYKKLAKKFRRKLKDWVKKGNPNVLHYKELVDAEWLALMGKNDDAIKKYEGAILMAGRRGLSQDRATAHELFSRFWLSIGDRTEAGYHTRKAIELFKEWGATAVASHLERAHPAL